MQPAFLLNIMPTICTSLAHTPLLHAVVTQIDPTVEQISKKKCRRKRLAILNKMHYWSWLRRVCCLTLDEVYEKRRYSYWHNQIECEPSASQEPEAKHERWSRAVLMLAAILMAVAYLTNEN